MEINEVVVMYLDASEIERPCVPDDVSPVSGILTAYSFLMLSRGVYAMRQYSCWCPACSRVRGRGLALGTISQGALLTVPGCQHPNLTVWREGQFTVTRSCGIANRKKRLEELWKKLQPQIQPGKFGCVQVRELWSTAEDRHYRPGHHWLFEFGDAGNGTSVEKDFCDLPHRSWQVYKGLRFYRGNQALTVRRWLHRVDADTSGLLFEDWDPSKETLDPNAQPAYMIINSSELRGVAALGTGMRSELRQLLPAPLQAVASRLLVSSHTRRGVHDRAAAAQEIQRSFVLRQDVDNEWRSRCE